MPRYCDHNTVACNRQGVGVGGGCSPFLQLSVFILEIQHNNLYYHYTNLTFVCDVCDVCESGRSREGHLTRVLLFLHRWTWTLQVAAH